MHPPNRNVNTRFITTNYTTLITDDIVIADATAGAITVTLTHFPDGAEHELLVIKSDVSANAVTVNGIVLSAQNASAMLTEDATGVWRTAATGGVGTGGGGTPGGLDTQVQFNDSSAFGGNAGLTYNKTANVLSLNGADNSLDLAGSVTTAPVTVTATGGDTNIPIRLVPKGASPVQLGITPGSAVGSPAELYLPALTIASNDITANIHLYSSGAAGYGPFIEFFGSEGTVASPTPMSVGDISGAIDFYVYNGTNYNYGAQIFSFVSSAPVGAGTPVEMGLGTTQNDGVFRTQFGIIPSGTITFNYDAGGPGLTADATTLKVRNFANSADAPLTALTLGLTGFIEQIEIADPAAPAANTGRVYMKDVGGKTALVVRFPSGAVQQIAIEP